MWSNTRNSSKKQRCSRAYANATAEASPSILALRNFQDGPDYVRSFLCSTAPFLLSPQRWLARPHVGEQRGFLVCSRVSVSSSLTTSFSFLYSSHPCSLRKSASTMLLSSIILCVFLLWPVDASTNCGSTFSGRRQSVLHRSTFSNWCVEGFSYTSTQKLQRNISVTISPRCTSRWRPNVHVVSLVSEVL